MYIYFKRANTMLKLTAKMNNKKAKYFAFFHCINIVSYVKINMYIIYEGFTMEKW